MACFDTSVHVLILDTAIGTAMLNLLNTYSQSVCESVTTNYCTELLQHITKQKMLKLTA